MKFRYGVLEICGRAHRHADRHALSAVAYFAPTVTTKISSIRSDFDFSYDIPTSNTDRQTDRQTDRIVHHS